MCPEISIAQVLCWVLSDTTAKNTRIHKKFALHSNSIFDQTFIFFLTKNAPTFFDALRAL